MFYTLCSAAWNISLSVFVVADTFSPASASAVSGCAGTGFTESDAGEVFALEAGPGVFPVGV